MLSWWPSQRSSVPSSVPWPCFILLCSKQILFVSSHKRKLHWEGNLLSLSCGGLSVWHSPWQVIRAIYFDYLSAPWSFCWLEKTLTVCDKQSDELRYFSTEHLRGQRAVGSENDELAESMVREGLIKEGTFERSLVCQGFPSPLQVCWLAVSKDS